MINKATRITAFPRINARRAWYQNNENNNNSISTTGSGFQRVSRSEMKQSAIKASSRTVIQTARARVKSRINANGRKKTIEYSG